MAEALIRVMIVDDHEIVRRGVRAILQESEGLEVVAEACDGEEAVARAEEFHPDVIIMDLMMPRMDGIEATRRVLDRNPGAKILVLTSFAGDDRVIPVIRAGALGYLLKDSSSADLVRAIRQVSRGEPSLPPTVARKVLFELAHPNVPRLAPDPLTERELTVLRLIAQGLSNRQIANQLVLSETTVRGHVTNVLSKLHLASRTQAALYAVREGLVSSEKAGPSDQQQ